ncbi:MAG: cysteine hydrolase [Pseudonocardiaceae bacterium]
MENYRGMAIPTTLEQVCDPQRMALLVYDMQVGVLGQIDDSAGVITRVATVLDAARSAGVRTFFTRHMTLPLEVTGTSGLRTAMTWQRTSNVDEVISAFPRDSPQFQIIPEVTPLAGEAVLDKIAMSAFAGTPLDFALRDCGIEAFAIVGVALEVGIEPTVRHSLDLGYLPVVVVDACG